MADAGARRFHAMPFGAEARDGDTRFRLWAPDARRVTLRLGDPDGDGVQEHVMEPVAGGFREWTGDAPPGTLYAYCIDDRTTVPDPASRHQPRDVHGPAEVIAPAAFVWTDTAWRGRPWEETVLYELHPGALCRQGGFDGVRRELDRLAHLGVTAVELMPVSDFPGRRNWGYDGVLPFAPDASYGRPEELKRLVAAAHRRELSVFLDVVYNHFGPEGNYLHLFARRFFDPSTRTPWGDAIDLDGPDSATVRDFFVHNALYWLEEFHLDGLRLDAVHALHDDSSPHFLDELARRVADGPGARRPVHLVLENDANEARHLRRDAAGAPRTYVAQWNDDFHHAVHCLLTGESGGYYADFAGDPVGHLGRVLAEGFAWQGEHSPYRQAGRGEPSADLPPTAFVNFLQNHDQVGNRAFGERLIELCDERALRAAVAILLLAPTPPLLFMGEETGCRRPFLFFCDFGADLARAVTEGRRREFARFPEFAGRQTEIPDPNAADTFERCRLDPGERDGDAARAWLEHYRRLLAVRHREIVPRLPSTPGGAARWTRLDETSLRVEWTLGDGSRLTLLTNLGGPDGNPGPAVAVPAGRRLWPVDDDDPAPADGGRLPRGCAAWYLDAR